MATHPYYDRPMVQRMQRIFDWPKPPGPLVQRQVDGAEEHLRKLAKSQWHEMDDWWAFLMDLTYLESIVFQRDLFDYVFPTVLIRWWEGQLDRTGGPHHESDIYNAIDRGGCLYSMMDDARREDVLDWIVDAYLQGVDSWSGELSANYNAKGPDNLHGPLWSFNALGQSVPVIEPILAGLEQLTTPGRAQWWLVFITGLAIPENLGPATPDGGGGGVYVTETATEIYDHGYLDENLKTMREFLEPTRLKRLLEHSREVLTRDWEMEWATDVIARIEADPKSFATRVERFSSILSEPDLGGVFSWD